MAEGLQRKIEYSDLKFTSSFAREKILDFQTWEVPGEHARGNFRLLLSENETGINSIPVGFSDGAVLVCPAVPDMAVQIMNVV